MKSDDVKKALAKVADKKRAKLLAGYFKTGKGQYGEGDIFLGVIVPEERKIAKKFPDLSLAEIKKLLLSKIHEHRMVALFILTGQFEKADKEDKKKIAEFYLKNSKNINNWDLVDLSACKILGTYLLDKPRDILYELAKSKNIWQRRIAVLATFPSIAKKDFKDILVIGQELLADEHDLMQKAVGWMLREVGKRDKKVLVDFLDKYTKEMSRTTLRYAIEKFPENERKNYLNK